MGEEEEGEPCFTAVSLDFCTTHQNSAACRQQLGGGQILGLRVGAQPFTPTVLSSAIGQAEQ